MMVSTELAATTTSAFVAEPSVDPAASVIQILGVAVDGVAFASACLGVPGVAFVHASASVWLVRSAWLLCAFVSAAVGPAAQAVVEVGLELELGA